MEHFKLDRLSVFYRLSALVFLTWGCPSLYGAYKHSVDIAYVVTYFGRELEYIQNIWIVLPGVIFYIFIPTTVTVLSASVFVRGQIPPNLPAVLKIEIHYWLCLLFSFLGIAHVVGFLAVSISNPEIKLGVRDAILFGRYLLEIITGVIAMGFLKNKFAGNDSANRLCWGLSLVVAVFLIGGLSSLDVLLRKTTAFGLF